MAMARLRRVCLALLIAVGSPLIGIGPAHAVTVDQTCAGTEVTSYDPPLTFTSRPTTITVSGIYPSCTDSVAFNGSYSETFTLTASCLALLDSGSTTRTFVWGDRQTSTFDYNVTANEVGGQLIVTNTGLITAGKFAPASGLQVITLTTPNILQCLGSGIANVTGPTTLVIFHM
jgi:hypothetical protein